MFGTLGGPELVLILVLALIIFGPRKLPEIGKSMGRMMAEFRKASNDFKRTIEDEIEAEKFRPPSENTSTAPAPAPSAALAGAESLPAETPAASEIRVSAPDGEVVMRGSAPPSAEPE